MVIAGAVEEVIFLEIAFIIFLSRRFSLLKWCLKKVKLPKNAVNPPIGAYNTAVNFGSPNPFNSISVKTEPRKKDINKAKNFSEVQL